MSSFAQALQELAGGSVYHDLSVELNEIVSAVRETRKPGEISIVLKIKPNGEHISTGVTVKTKLPKHPYGDTMFFVGADGSLLRNDPRQEQLPLRQVMPPSIVQPLRTIVTEAEVVTNG